MHKVQTSQLKNLICFDAIHATSKIFRVGFMGKIMLQLCYGTIVAFGHWIYSCIVVLDESNDWK